MSFQLVQKSVTLNDPERCNGLVSLFHRIRSFRRHSTDGAGVLLKICYETLYILLALLLVNA